jgi:glycosyltransferase involved in cell wall biosynthesis
MDATYIPPDRRYTFYTLGAWSERKNPLGMLKAYLHGFKKSDPVRLIAIIHNCDFDAIRSLIARSGIADDELPSMLIPDATTPMSEGELVRLHTESDCFVSATRGEGWGLGAFEAALVGNAVVMPGYGGQLDYLEGYENWLELPFVMTPAFPDETDTQIMNVGGRQMAVAKSAVARGVDCKQLWAEPDLGEMADAMRRSFHEGRGFIKSGSGRASFEERFSYSTVGPILVRKLQEICNESV